MIIKNFADYKKHYAQTIQLGGPIMLGQLGIIVVGFADNMMVGHHSTLELAAASFVNNFFTLAFIFGIGFSYGLTPIMSGLFARGKHSDIGQMLKNSLLINFCVGIVVSLVMLTILFNIDLLNQPKELMPYIIPYYLLQVASIIFAMTFNSFKQFSDGTMDTKTPMWIMLGANVFNIFGNYLLIYGNFGFPELGLTGAGISTLTSRILTVIAFALLFAKGSRYKQYIEGFKQGTWNRKNINQLIHLGLPVGILMGVETASFSLSVVMMGWLGTVALAAHQIVGVVTTLGFMIYYGIAAAVAIRVSRFRSLGDNTDIRRASFAGLHIITIVALIVVTLVFIARNQIGYLFTTEPEVIALVGVLSYSVILYQFGDGLQILFSNALRGIEDVKYMAYAAFICHFLISLPIGYFCGFILDWGAVGIWCGFPISLTTLGVILYFRFNKITRLKDMK